MYKVVTLVPDKNIVVDYFKQGDIPACSACERRHVLWGLASSPFYAVYSKSLGWNRKSANLIQFITVNIVDKTLAAFEYVHIIQSDVI